MLSNEQNLVILLEWYKLKLADMHKIKHVRLYKRQVDGTSSDVLS